MREFRFKDWSIADSLPLGFSEAEQGLEFIAIMIPRRLTSVCT